MAEKESHPIRNGIIAAVTAGVLLSFWPPFRNLILTFLKWAWDMVRDLAIIVIAQYSIPGWIIIVLLILAFPTCFRIFSALRKKRIPGVYEQYSTDNLFGAIWEWTYNGKQVVELWCLCPECKSELVYEEHRRSNRITRYNDEADNTKFICAKCQQVRVKLSGLLKYALATVEREIRRKIRTGEWKESAGANLTLERDGS